MRSKMLVCAMASLLLAGCGSKKTDDESGHKGKVSQAELELRAIEKALKSHYAEQAMFPTGTAANTPTVACCEGPNHKCPVNSGDWVSNPLWSALDFELTEPSFFQYAYESEDGKTAVARAVGDLDCDLTTVEFVLRCESAQGMPTCTLTPPERPD